MFLLPRFVVPVLPLLAVIGCHAPHSTDEAARSAAPELKVMSFNVRLSAGADGENIWPNRSESFFEAIRRFNPDLIGFQEVLEDQYIAIGQQLPGHAFCGGARNDGKRSGEWSLVAFRKDRFDKLSHGDFWLSEQPAVPGSKSWDAAITRICTWTRLKDRVTGQEFIFANTHFDHKGVIARRESSRLLSKRISTIAGNAPAVLTGDFNFPEDDPGYATLVRPDQADLISWIDSYRSVHPRREPDEASYHGFQGTLLGSRIDYIFHTADFKATKAKIDRWVPKSGRWPSDHYPVTAVLQWKRGD